MGGWLNTSSVVISIGATASVRCREVVRLWVGPLWEVPLYTWELQKVLQSTWVSQLQLFVSDIGSLSSSSRMFVNLIVSNYFAQKHSVLNWLITAQLTANEPLQNILVISIDNTLNQLLENHGIPSIHPHSTPYNLEIHSKKVWPRISSTNGIFTVMCLLCYWGIDVAHYDPEAVILRNPHKLYNRHPDTDILGALKNQYAHGCSGRSVSYGPVTSPLQPIRSQKGVTCMLAQQLHIGI